MSKAEITKESKGGKLAVPEELSGGSLVTGGEAAQPKVGRLVLYQGTSEEADMYGEHPRGTFLDSLMVEDLGKEVRVMPVAGWYQWAKWSPDSSVPVYSVTDKSQVPPEDLEWIDDKPPACTEIVNMLVVVEGQEWPYLLQFKGTGLKTYTKTVQPVEARRAGAGRGPGAYILIGVDDKNAAGKAFKRLTARVDGDPSPEMLHTGVGVKRMFDTYRAEADKQANGDGGDGDIPF